MLKNIIRDFRMTIVLTYNGDARIFSFIYGHIRPILANDLDKSKL